jgi:hypothetical protein
MATQTTAPLTNAAAPDDLRKRHRRPQHERGELPRVKLPKHVELSEDELAIVVRLVRVLRERDYWVGAFVEWLLYTDCRQDAAWGVNIDDAKKALEDIDGLNSWVNWMHKAKTEREPILRYFGHRFFPDRVDEMISDRREVTEHGEGTAFHELVKLWRSVHPEPERRAVHPAGHLGRKESGD